MPACTSVFAPSPPTVPSSKCLRLASWSSRNQAKRREAVAFSKANVDAPSHIEAWKGAVMPPVPGSAAAETACEDDDEDEEDEEEEELREVLVNLFDLEDEDDFDSSVLYAAHNAICCAAAKRLIACTHIGNGSG